MQTPRVYIVHLRRPKGRSSDPDEMRSDPFWEFGSFGCTTCHSNNLLNARSASMLKGARLAFAQGGPCGFRLVYLTPPIGVFPIGDLYEVKWSPIELPFKYRAAPIIVANEEDSDMPLLEAFVEQADRDTLEGGFSSCFRSRASPLEREIAEELVAVYDEARQAAAIDDIATSYTDALPWLPPKTDQNRKKTYEALLAAARGTAGVNTVSCENSKRRISAMEEDHPARRRRTC